MGQILDDLDKIGLVIGHTDSMGFMWMDYSHHPFLSKEIKEIKEEVEKALTQN